ncbi:MAG: HDOD domain-containing protein [Candidatus Eisenbacteria bacterium]|nr:HDOD domain-containing protein [Candidatus Eisenbacteria bacterium]
MADSSPYNPLHRVQQAMSNMEPLPPVPEAIAVLWEVIDHPKTTIDQLTEIVEADPALTVSLLRVVNSASFSLRRKIVNVRDAIIYAGLGELKNISIALVVQTGLLLRKPGLQNFDVDRLWRHSVGTAILSRYLARLTRAAKTDLAFVAGLLHDAGWIVLDQTLPELVAQILREARENEETIESREFRHLGFTHADTSAWLIQKWRLPKGLAQAAQHHHKPRMAPKNNKLPALVHLADTIAAQSDPYLPGLPQPKDPTEEAWGLVGLSPTAGIPAVRHLEKELGKVSELLRVTV